MTLARGRVIREAEPMPRPTNRARPRVLPFEVLEARDEAGRILEAAAEAARDEAARIAEEARQIEIAKLAAGFLELREREARVHERDIDRAIELAVLLAERLVGEAIRLDPTRIRALAEAALAEARGADRVRIDAHPDDLPELERLLSASTRIAEVQADATLTRGSLVLHTDLGRVDGRLSPQLDRLAAVLKEALR